MNSGGIAPVKKISRILLECCWQLIPTCCVAGNGNVSAVDKCFGLSAPDCMGSIIANTPLVASVVNPAQNALSASYVWRQLHLITAEKVQTICSFNLFLVRHDDLPKHRFFNSILRDNKGHILCFSQVQRKSLKTLPTGFLLVVVVWAYENLKPSIMVCSQFHLNIDFLSNTARIFAKSRLQSFALPVMATNYSFSKHPACFMRSRLLNMEGVSTEATFASVFFPLY